MTGTTLAPRAPAMRMGTLEDPAELGRVLAASGYFNDAREAAQAVVKVLAGAELGFGPIASMTGVYIVKGRVTLSANLMAAAIKRHPAYDYRIAEHTEAKAAVFFLDATRACSKCKGTGRVEGDKRCPSCWGSGRDCLGISEFTIDMARNAGLAGGENWRKYPSNMLLWRAMSNGAKFFAPDAFSGAPIYTPDELGAEIDPETGDFVGDVVDVPTPAPRSSDTARADTTSAEPATTAEAPTDDRPADAPENAATAAPASAPDDNGQGVSDDEHAKLAELLDAVNAPDSFRRMALMSYGVDDFSQLTKHQAREVMGRAMARFGSKGGGAA